MKVLIVEDQPIVLKTMQRYVAQLAHEVFTASDGSEALILWEKEQPDVVITDWNMPGKNGLEVIQYIRERDSSNYTYTLMITARDDNEDLLQGYEVGVDDFMVKPVSKRELTLRLKAAERLLNLQSRDMLVFALASLAETRDEDTGIHLERIRLYCKLLAEALCEQELYKGIVNRRFMDTLYATSPLHDIGKVGIPDYILKKADSLCPQEYELMKSHTILGESTLLQVMHKHKNNTYLQMAADIAGAHHEKWDGTGYPRGLKGESIPLAARILAIADVYDALRSERVYKKGYTHCYTLKLMKSESGKHFDPSLFSVFESIEDRFRAISVENGQYDDLENCLVGEVT
jgi:putative two-component system response regulator